MTRARRILYVVNAFETDAPTTVTLSTARGMKEAGWDVMVLAWSRGGDAQRSNLASAGIETHLLGKGFAHNAATLARHIREFSPDIVHAALARPAIGLFASRLFPVGIQPRWIVSDHGVHEWHEKGQPRGAAMDRIMPAILSTMDAIVAVSNDAANELTRRGVARQKVHVIPNGVDPCRFYPRPTAGRARFISEHFPDQDAAQTIDILIGSAGNLRKLKGYDTLLDAMPHILATAPTIRCVIWGDGPERPALEKQARDLGIAHAVTFAPFDPQLEHRLPLLDIYIQPSRVESFGMATAEAMACGVPVVVSDAGNLKNLVRHGVSGRIYPAEDPHALANQVLQLASEKRKRRRIGAAGRQHILQHYTARRMITLTHALYESVLMLNGGAS